MVGKSQGGGRMAAFGVPFFMDRGMQNILNQVVSAIQGDDDVVHLVTGVEGAGKSVLALQMAWYVDRSFTLDRVCFSFAEFSKAVKAATKGQSIILDEGQELSWRGGGSRLTSLFISLFQQMRQKNLYIIVVIPQFGELTSYMAVNRSKALFYVYKRRVMDETGMVKSIRKGFWRCWGTSKKNDLYAHIKKHKDISIASTRGDIKPKFRGRFPRHYTPGVDEELYKAKKLASFEKFSKKVSKFLKEQEDELVKEEKETPITPVIK
jgi:hypothetical protein